MKANHFEKSGLKRCSLFNTYYLFITAPKINKNSFYCSDMVKPEAIWNAELCKPHRCPKVYQQMGSNALQQGHRAWERGCSKANPCNVADVDWKTQDEV